jgi:hypothetical protein
MANTAQVATPLIALAKINPTTCNRATLIPDSCAAKV